MAKQSTLNLGIELNKNLKPLQVAYQSRWLNEAIEIY